MRKLCKGMHTGRFKIWQYVADAKGRGKRERSGITNEAIMFLTAADEETDMIMGLDMGGEDYITKPFKLAVFLSRLNALLRRSENFNTDATD